MLTMILMLCLLGYTDSCPVVTVAIQLESQRVDTLSHYTTGFV